MNRVLVIDNFDSFTYNIVQYLGELGAEVEVFRNDGIIPEAILARNPSHLIISPGPCSPNEAGVSVDAIRTCVGKIPVLGVCLGHQAIDAAFGGTIVRAKRLMHGKVSRISHDGKGVFRGLPDPFIATRYHSLAVERKSLPACLAVSATSEEGEIMGLRHRHHAVEGVQFHPESILTQSGMELLANFLRFKTPSVKS